MLNEIGGLAATVNQNAVAPMRREADFTVPPGVTATFVEIGSGDGSGSERAKSVVITMHDLPAAANIQALSQLQRQRQFCIKTQSKLDRACEAFIARYLGYNQDLPKAERKAIWKKATAIRRVVEKGGEDLQGYEHHQALALAACTPIILNSAASREAWDKHRAATEKYMRKLARTLPVWSWVQSVSGFGELGLAIIVGETGDLTNRGMSAPDGYATKERVWKRLGLAVIDGERQQRKSGTEAAAAHGYSSTRRAEVWTIADSMFKHQWRGVKEDAPAGPAGPYGAVYAHRKAHVTALNEMGAYAERAARIVEGMRKAHKTPLKENVEGRLTSKHIDTDARRIMTKALIEDLWRVWNGLPALAGAET